MNSVLVRLLRRQPRVLNIPATHYSTTPRLFGRHHGSSYEKYQKARSNKKKKKYVDPAKDRKGKVHSQPGMRIAEKVEQSHKFQASLAGNRHPAMWNDPYYNRLYEEIVAIEPAPEVEGSLQDLLSVNPDELRHQLETRYEQFSLLEQQHRTTSSLNDNNLNLRSMILEREDTIDLVSKLKNDLIQNVSNTSNKNDHDNEEDLKRTNYSNSFSSVLDKLTTSLNDFSIENHRHNKQDAFGQSVSKEEQSEIELPSAAEWRHLLRVYGAHKRTQDVLDIVSDLKKKGIAFQSSSHQRTINESDTNKIGEKIQSDNEEQNYATLIITLAESGALDRAEALFDDMRWNVLTPTVISWSALIHAQVASGGNLRTAYLIMQRMREEGVKPNVVSYTSLLSALFAHADKNTCFDQANEVWFDMTTSGIEPSLLTYTAMIKCCCRSQQMERALNIIDEMRQHKVRPSLATYNTLLRGVATTPQWHRAMALVSDEILDLMQSDEIIPDQGSFHALITSCDAVGDIVNAKYYFNEMQKSKFGFMKPTSDIYAALLHAYGSSQCVGKSECAKRFLTRERGWPVIPKLGPPGMTAAEKTSRLNWDMMDEEKGKKFKGFIEDIRDDLDYEYEEDDDEYDFNIKKEEEEYEYDDYDSVENSERIESYNDEFDSDDDNDNQSHTSSSSMMQLSEGQENELVSEEKGEGLSWQVFMQKQIEEADAIVAKGERKKLAKLARLENGEDFDDDVDEKSVNKKSLKQRKKDTETGYKGAANIEEEWELLVHDVYDQVKSDDRFPAEVIAKLKNEVDKYPKQQEMTLLANSFFEDDDNDAEDEEEEEVDGFSEQALLKEFGTQFNESTSHPQSQQGQLFQDEVQNANSSDHFLRSLNPTTAMSANLTKYQAPEDGMPWITTKELLEFDWDEASRNAPLKGTRYPELPRLIDRMEESKEFSKLSFMEKRQALNIEEGKALIAEMEQKQLQLNTQVLNGMLSIFTKAMRVPQAQHYFPAEFQNRNIQPNHQSYRLMVEMYLRNGRVDKALAMKDDMMKSGCGADPEVFGVILRKLADKDLLHEALELLDEAKSHNLVIRERNKRELRRRLVKEGMQLHPLIGQDPEAWRKDAAIARRSQSKKDNKKAYILRNMMVGH